MRYVGRITEWSDERGFGFVTANGGGDRTFFHINSFQRGGARPALGQLVSWEAHRDERGRCNAVDVRFVDLRAASLRQPGKDWPRKSAAVVCMAVLMAGWVSGKFPLVIVMVYAALSAVAMRVYALDKSVAKRNAQRNAQCSAQRTPENYLHLIALLGGWPGALFAQNAFHHKSRKAAFQVKFFVTVVVNCAGLVAAVKWSGPVLKWLAPKFQRLIEVVEQVMGLFL